MIDCYMPIVVGDIASHVCTYLLLATVVLLIILFILCHKEDKDMAVIYVQLIIKGLRTYSSVPKTLKPQVKQLLIDLELEFLIDEA